MKKQIVKKLNLHLIGGANHPITSFFCEDIEPVYLIWTKVDEAMLTSSSSAESSFGDQDFDGFSNDDIKTALCTARRS